LSPPFDAKEVDFLMAPRVIAAWSVRRVNSNGGRATRPEPWIKSETAKLAELPDDDAT
jgi:hypothetical protein